MLGPLNGNIQIQLDAFVLTTSLRQVTSRRSSMQRSEHYCQKADDRQIGCDQLQEEPRLTIGGMVTKEFLPQTVEWTQAAGLICDDHFMIDGTLLDSWASMKSFQLNGRNVLIVNPELLRASG